jgi:hypothetical protein
MNEGKEKPLLKKNCRLEKFPGKGGWTFTRLPEIKKDKKSAFGWVKVRGFIDSEEIRKYHLMPMNDGHLFLPINAAIRKKIKKESGDTVHVELYNDNDPLDIPEEFLLCLRDEPKADVFFHSLSESKQKFYIEWIFRAKKNETKINRMALAVTKLSNKQKLYAPTKHEQQ